MRWAAFFLVSISLVIASASQAIAQKKVALVIGNSAYPSQSLGGNPVRDANLVGEGLQKLGFDLVGGRALVDLDQASTNRMVGAFALKAQGADIALFYFAGHGVQVDGTNYLLPIDFGPFTPGSLVARTLNANIVLDAMNKSGARAKVMLLDACRTRFARGPGDGLAVMKAPGKGAVIGFATQPDAIAWSGPENGNSPYAKALSTFMRVKGLQIYSLLNEVGLAVMSATNNMQQPWVATSPIEGAVIINPPAPTDAIQIGKEVPVPPAEPTTPRIVQTGAASAFVQQAYKQLEKNDYAGARATLTKGIAAEEFAPAYSFRGFSWYQEGKSKDNLETAIVAYRQAFPDLDKAIELDPTYSPARRHRGNTILATFRALKATGKPTNDILDRAIDDFKVAVNLDPQSKTNANALGEAYLLKGAYGLAIENFNKAIALDRKYSSPYSGLCSAYYMQGKKTEARKNADLAASLDSKFAPRSCLSNTI